MSGKKDVCPQRQVATAVFVQPPVVECGVLTLAQSVPKGWSMRLNQAHREL